MGKLKVLTRWEAVVIAAAVLGFLVWLFFPKTAGGTVEITAGGAPVAALSLKEPARLPVTGAHGVTLTVVVEGGAAHVEGATCPDLLCARHSPVSRAGESIVCLPGQIVVTVKGGSAHGPDAVSG